MWKPLTMFAWGISLWAQNPVPVPKVTGPIPETATSRIFGAATRNLTPLALSSYGYVEEEYLLSGTANVYDWQSDGSVTVKGAGAPYTTRIVVRRPSDAAKFNGTVIVEIPNTARRYDWPMMWGYSGEFFVKYGMAWVEIGMPPSAASMKKVDPARYGSLSFGNVPEACPAATPGGTEDGLRYDLFSQVAATVKSKLPGMPLAGFDVQRAFLTTQDTGLITYINAFHERNRLSGNKPAYDGYLIKVLNAPGLINSCAKALEANDPRRMLKPVDVPTIAVLAQGEVEAMAWSRLPDSDGAAGSGIGKHRRYEVAMASHIDKLAYGGMPNFPEQTAAGNAQGTQEWPFTARCEPEITLQDEPALRTAFNMAFWNLDQWVRNGTAPPRADRMRLDAQGKLLVNEYGIGTGGVRSPLADMPVARYLTASGGPGNCREFGSSHALSWAELEKLYGDHAKYARKVSAEIADMVTGKWLVDSDAADLKKYLGVQ